MTDEPFAAFRCKLVFGRNKHDSSSIPISDLELEKDLLPENSFRLFKSGEGYGICAGSDATDRCFFMVDIEGGTRGGCGVEECDGTVIAGCSAANACSSATAVAVLLAKGQSVALYSYGRNCDEVQLYTWNGAKIAYQRFTKAEWKYWKSSADTDADVEIL